jgi:hypothetical protein
MERVQLKFLKDWRWYKPGDVVELKSMVISPKGAHRLILEGIAERYIPKKFKAENDALG